MSETLVRIGNVYYSERNNFTNIRDNGKSGGELRARTLRVSLILCVLTLWLLRRRQKLTIMSLLNQGFWDG